MELEDAISPRLITLRKHLGDRLGEKLTTEYVGDKCGLAKEQVYRMENGLNGTVTSFISLLRFYQSHGYNLDWILSTDESLVPMMLSNSQQMQQIALELNQMSQYLGSSASRLMGHLRAIGYESLAEVPVESASLIPEASGLVL